MSKIPGRVLDTNKTVQFASFTATLAEINAGKTLLAPKPNLNFTVVGMKVRVTGAFTTLTDIRLSDIDSAGATAADIFTIAQAQLTNGAIHSDVNGTNTVGAGFMAALGANKGVQIRKTGSTGAGGTSVRVELQYLINNK